MHKQFTIIHLIGVKWYRRNNTEGSQEGQVHRNAERLTAASTDEPFTLDMITSDEDIMSLPSTILALI